MDTTIPNFGKVEYFSAYGLTHGVGVLPDGNARNGAVGWAKRKRAHVFFVVNGRWWARRKCAFAHPMGPPYSAAICLGAGGGLARSAASWA
ncbi:hypothetical protein ACVIU7_000296 [Bradyrhizobium liaoningense]